MDIERAFLADIRENPDDDAPRLVYADWLTDQGDEDAGAFIRVQVEMATLDEDSARYDELEGVAMRLEPRVRRGLLRRCGIDDEASAAVFLWSFHRGLPDGVSLTARCAQRYGERLIADAPISIANLSFMEPENASGAFGLFDRPGLRGLSVSGSSSAGAAGLGALLFREGLFPRLERFSFDCCRLPPDVTAAAEWLNARPLQSLWLNNLADEREEVAELFDHLRGDKLRRVDMHDRVFDTEFDQLVRMLSAPACRNLDVLAFSGFGGTELEARVRLDRLAELGTLSHMRQIDCGANRLAENSFAALAAWPRLRAVHFSNLWVNTIRDVSPLAELRNLNLDGAERSRDVFAVLDGIRSPGLRSLSLAGSLRRRNMPRLLRLPVLRGLRSLDLRECELTASNVEAIIRAPFFAGLRELYLDDPIGDEAVIRLVEASRDTEMACLRIRAPDAFGAEAAERLRRFNEGER